MDADSGGLVSTKWDTLDCLYSAYVDSHHQKALKPLWLITNNLLSRGNRTPDCCYNERITIMPLAQLVLAIKYSVILH